MAYDRLEHGITPYIGKGQPIYDECGAFRGYAKPAGAGERAEDVESALVEVLVALRDCRERPVLRTAS